MKKFSHFFNKILNNLHKNLKLLLVIYFLVQVLYIIFIPIRYSSDSLYYLQLAQDCLKQHSIYPAPNHIFHDYIIAPLYINVITLLLFIYNSTVIIAAFNIILNFVQLYLIFRITGKIFDIEKAKTAVILYVFYLSTLGLILFNLTELLFMVLVLSSISLYQDKTLKHLLFSGICAGLAIAVRPLGWALIASYIMNYFFLKEKNSLRVKSIFMQMTGVILTIALYGLLTYSTSGRFIFTSTNGSVNLLIGANKNATGAYNEKVFEKGNEGYLEQPGKMTYSQKQNFWRAKAVKYIISHPVKWVSLFPMKIIHIFIWDDFSIHKLLNFNEWNLYRILKNLIAGGKDKSLLGDEPLLLKILYFIILIFHHLYYFSLLVFFGITISKYFKDIVRNDYLRQILLFIVAGILIHLLTFGDARFKYPYIILMMIFVSPLIQFIKNYKNILPSKNQLIYV